MMFYLLFACLAVGAIGSEDDRIKLMKIPEFGFHAKVEVTKEEQQETIYVDEYFSKEEDMGRIDILAHGNRFEVHYYNRTQQIIYVEDQFCKVTSYSKSEDILHEYYGWKLGDFKMFGPTALIFKVWGREQDLINSTAVIRGITTISLTLVEKSPTENLTITYYVQEPNWISPYSAYKGYIPIRFEVKGTIKINGKDIHIDQVLDYAYFNPLPQFDVYEPPYGIGCLGKKEDDDIDFSKPSIPNSFSLTEEIYNIKKADDGKPEICTARIWYDFQRKLVRADSSCGTEASVLQDFNTGVSYVIIDDKKCQIGPIDNSKFEMFSRQSIVGKLKNPNQLFGFSNHSYYLGQTIVRGINSDIYEEVGYDVTLAETYYKIVATYFFSATDVEVSVEGEMKFRVLLRILLKAYKSREDKKPSLNSEYNIFRFTTGFTEDFARSFNFESCFPYPSQKSYITLFFRLSSDAIVLAEKNNLLFESLLDKAIRETAHVSESRLSYFRVEYLDTGIIATGVLLERPPYMAGFKDFSDTGNVIPTVEEIQISTGTKLAMEQCARLCTQYEKPCLYFHYCKGDCFLSTMTIDVEWGQKLNKYKKGDCQLYKRNVLDSNIADEELEEALHLLKRNYTDIKIPIQMEGKDNENLLEYVPTSINIGSNPYEKEEEENSYEVVFTGFGFDDSMVVTDVGEVSSERECFQYCRNTNSLVCSSFAYCKKTKSCRLTSVVARQQDEDTASILKEDSTCNVFTRAYLDQFTEYPGVVTFLSGDVHKKNAETAEKCAQLCRLEKSITCRGFEYCKESKDCTLHKTHFMDFNAQEISDGSILCSHFALNYTYDYGYLTNSLLANDDDRIFAKLSIDACARKCSEEYGDECKTFSYCPPKDIEGTDTTCILSKHDYGDAKTKTADSQTCELFYKKLGADGWSRRQPKIIKKIEEPDGYSGGTFAGIVVGMIILGLIVGVAISVGYSRYKAKTSGEDMSVKFVNSS